MSVLNTVLHSTLQKSRKKLLFASMKAHALMAWAFATNRVEFEDGGRHITNPLITGRNSNVGSYEYYDALPIAQTDEFTTVEYNWSRVGGSVIISDQEEDESRGNSQIFKLMKEKLNVLEESMKEKFGAYMYGTATGTDPNGLGNLIPDDPTTGTLGGISRASESQWRTSSYDFDGSIDETVIEEVCDDINMDLTLKSSKPSIMVFGRNLMRHYRNAARDRSIMQITATKDGQRMMDLGFGGFSHNNVPIVYDEDCPVNKGYFINDTYMRLHILRHVNMKVKNLASPWTVDAVGKRIVWQGQWCVWSAYRRHAVLINE